ncbi:hypothetical protein BG004_006053 [Podila humilis]|nr:hypothetical protein BG004_006053 [Podila humilis]
MFAPMIPASWGVVQREPTIEPEPERVTPAKRRARARIIISDSEEETLPLESDTDEPDEPRPRTFGDTFIADHEWGTPLRKPNRALARQKKWDQERKERRLKIEQDLKGRGLCKRTITVYAKDLAAWEDFCHSYHNGDIVINTRKVEQFVRSYLMAGGVIRKSLSATLVRFTIGRTKKDPLTDPEGANAEAAEIRAKFAQASLRKGPTYFLMPLSEKSIHAMISSLGTEWTHQRSMGTNRFIKPTKNVGLAKHIVRKYHRSLVLTEEANKHLSGNFKIGGAVYKVKWAPNFQKRHWFLPSRVKVPSRPKAGSSVRKSRLQLSPNTVPKKPKKKSSSFISICAATSTSALQHRVYTAKEFVQVLQKTWKTYHTTKQVSAEKRLHDRALISLRHHGFLLDARIKLLMLGNLFVEHVKVSTNGASDPTVQGIGIQQPRGEITRLQRVSVNFVFRQSDHHRCPVGALAFYLFERLHVNVRYLRRTISFPCQR